MHNRRFLAKFARWSIIGFGSTQQIVGGNEFLVTGCVHHGSIEQVFVSDSFREIGVAMCSLSASPTLRLSRTISNSG